MVDGNTSPSLFHVTRFTAAGENDRGSTLLLTKGALKVSGRPLLHSAEANAVKSPASIAAVGTNCLSATGVWTLVVV